MLERLVQLLKAQAFLPAPLGLVTNPLYIIRRGLYRQISALAPTLHGEILDFGCGSKPYRTLFSNVSRYTGVDIESSGHDHKFSKIDVYYDGSNLPFSESSFDAVVSFEVFEHIFNLEDILQEIHRVIKKDGVLLFSIPFAWEEHESPFDYARYTSFGIKSLLARHSFQVEREIKTTNYAQAVGQLCVAYLYQYVLPENRHLRFALQVLLLFPLTSLVLLLARVFPERYEYYSNLIIVCRVKK